MSAIVSPGRSGDDLNRVPFNRMASHSLIWGMVGIWW